MTRNSAMAVPANDGALLSDEHSSGVTRYRQLASVLRHKIVSGEYPIGQQLPTVESLARTYGIAKVTVRQAMALLSDDGLVSSQRGRGTHVIKRPSGPGERLRSAINDASVGASADLEIRILQKQKNAELPPELLKYGKAVDHYVMLRKLHAHDGVPFCLIEMYVAASVFSRFKRGGENHHKLIQMLRQTAGDRLGMTYQTMTVEPADHVLVHELAYEFGAPVARMARNILDVDDNILMAGLFWYRGDRFILDMSMPAQLSERYPKLTIPDTRK